MEAQDVEATRWILIAPVMVGIGAWGTDVAMHPPAGWIGPIAGGEEKAAGKAEPLDNNTAKEVLVKKCTECLNTASIAMGLKKLRQKNRLSAILWQPFLKYH